MGPSGPPEPARPPPRGARWAAAAPRGIYREFWGSALIMARLVDWLGFAALGFGVLLLLGSIGLYVIGAVSFNYDLSGWGILMFVVGLVLLVVGWRACARYDRAKAAGPAGGIG